VLVALPARLPVVFFWVTLVVAVTVLLGAFRPLVVVPAAVLLAGLAWRLAPDRLPADRSHVRGAAWALGLTVAWLLANLWFTGEVLLVQRDPGFLTLEGIWLSGSPDPDVPLRSAADVAARVPEASVVSDAFWRDGDHIYAQGAKTFPGLIAMAGWVAGQPGVLAANLLVGAVALLAVYDVGRRLITPGWALLPFGALALSTPFLYFTRTPFTEPTNIALTFGGLAVLWGAFARPQVARFALGGAMVGASALSRIDGAAVAAGLVLALGLVAAGSRDAGRRRALVHGFLAATGSAGLMVLLGYLDVRVNSAGYLADHAWLYQPLIAMLVASVVAALVGLAATRSVRLRRWLAERRDLLGRMAMWAVLVLSAALATRPLWGRAHLIEPGSAQSEFIAAFQRAAGVAVDPTRSYDEMTVVWLAWYLGPVTVALAAVGAAVMARRAVGERRPDLLVLLVTLGVPALLYLVRPAITPDQIWAMRRFLPAVIPAALLCAAWLLHRMLAGSRDPWLRGGAWLGAGLMVLSPLATWGTLVVTGEYRGRADQVARMCEAVDGRRVVVVRASDPPLLPTLRIVCDADVVELPGGATAAELAGIRQAWGGGEVLVATMTGEAIDWPAGAAPTLSGRIARWPHSLYPSYSPIRFTSDLWLGTIGDDGTITPVELAGP
jgi:hypothetical protein